MARFYPSGGAGGGVGSDELTATKDHVLSGRKYVGSDTNDDIGTGSIPSKGATTHYATTSDQTISAGQYLSGDQKISKLTQSNLSAGNIKTGVNVKVNNGNGNVFDVTGTFCSDATLASGGSMLKDVIGYGKDGAKVVGTIASKGATTHYATTSDQTILSAGQYLSGAQTLKKLTSSNLSAGNIKKGVVIKVNNGSTDVFSVTGTLAVTSAINFKATAQSASVIRISWTNPSTGPWEGVEIRMSTTGNPGVSGGTQKYKGKGNSTTAGGSNYVDITGLDPATTYYFTCTSYATGLGNGASYNVSAKTKGLIVFANGAFQNGFSMDEEYGTGEIRESALYLPYESDQSGYVSIIHPSSFSGRSYSSIHIDLEFATSSYQSLYGGSVTMGDAGTSESLQITLSVSTRKVITMQLVEEVNDNFVGSVAIDFTYKKNATHRGTPITYMYKVWFE